MSDLDNHVLWNSMSYIELDPEKEVWFLTFHQQWNHNIIAIKKLRIDFEDVCYLNNNPNCLL